MAGTKVTNSWSSAGSIRDFQAESPCYHGEPRIVSERAAVQQKWFLTRMALSALRNIPKLF